MGIEREEYLNLIALKETYDEWSKEIVRISYFKNNQKRYALWLLGHWEYILYMSLEKILSLKNKNLRKRYLKQRSFCIDETYAAFKYTLDWDEYSQESTIEIEL